MKGHIRVGTALLVSSVTAFSMSAQAQEAPKGAPAVAAGGLETIVVTARKRVESAQDIPVSVTVLSPQQIQRKDISSLEKLSARQPELVITRSASGSGASLSMRGVGSNFSSVGIEQSVAVIVDGTYYGHGRVIEEGFFDLARIEVLKGPQALFFGKNATAGVISITSADPGPEAEFMGKVGYETTAEELYGEAVASMPVNDKLAIRVAMRASKMYGGYSQNLSSAANYTVTDASNFASTTLTAPAAKRDQPGTRGLIGRLTLKWTPTDNLTDTLKISGTRSRGGAPGYNAYVGCAGTNFQRNPAIACGRKFTTYMNDPPAQFLGGTATRKAGLYNDYDSYAINNVLNYEMTNASLTSVLNFNNNRSLTNADYSAEGDGGIWVPIDARFRAFSSETRVLTTFDSPINLLAGFYYQSSKRRHAEDVTFFGAYNSTVARANQYLAFNKPSQTRGKTYSGYGQLIWKATPELELTGGARYTHETKDSNFNQPYVNAFFGGVFLQNSPIARHQVFNNASPDATITYRPSSEVTVYAAYKTGYKSGGFSNSAVQTPADPTGNNFIFGPEKAKGFEVGVKTTLFENQLRFNVGGYRYTFSGLQVDYYDPINVQYITKNAGSARSQGIEVEAEYAPRALQGMILHGSINYNRSRYRNFIGPCYTGQSQGAGCTIYGPNDNPATTLPSLQQLGGKATANAPSWTGTLGFEYTTDLSDDFIAGVSSDLRYSSSYNASPFGLPISRQKSYVTLDASVRFGAASELWELAVIGKNLTNKQILTGSFDITGTGSGTGSVAGGLGPDYFGYSAMPRTIQLQASFRY